MSNQLFNFNSSPVRIEIFDNQPFFCLLDVCRIFQIQNSRRVQSQMLDPQGVRLAYALAKDEKQRKTAFINEPNLYRIIFRSEKPIAKSFQNWVFEEVLPQIRKTGAYSTQPQQLALPKPEKKYPVELSESDLQNLAWDWFALFKCVEFTRNIVPALDAIQSKFAPQARSIVSEYGSMLRRHQPLIQKLTAQFEIETWGDENWNRVLPTIRDNAILNPRKRLPHHNF